MNFCFKFYPIILSCVVLNTVLLILDLKLLRSAIFLLGIYNCAPIIRANNSSWSGCTSVEVLGRRWLDSRSSPLDHARENMPDEPRQADWLFNSGVYESPPLQGATSYPAAAGGAAVAGNANAAANANAAGVHADIAIGAANIATTRTHLVVPEDAHSEGIDRFRTHHELDQGQRRPSRFKPKKRRQPR